MSTLKSKQELTDHKDIAIKKLENYINTLIQSNNTSLNGKADKLSYWIEDYVNFLEFEPIFTPSSLKRYKRGDILQVHLEYKIGSEEGGLHYAVVLDQNNSIHSPIITIIPLTSIKSNKDLNNLRPTELNLGCEIYNQLNNKIKDKNNKLATKLDKLKKAQEGLTLDNPAFNILSKQIDNELDIVENDLKLLNKMICEIKKMKKGSIALINQITTISKIRIYDPKKSFDVLHGIRLKEEQLDLIDNAVKSFFLKNV